VDNQGWWSDTLANHDLNDNYATGVSGLDRFRSFFTFDLSSLTGVVLSVRMELSQYLYSSTEQAETIQFFDVSTDAATLNNNTGTNAAIFDDLGSGTVYGNIFVPAYESSDPFNVLSFDLSSATVADINAALDGIESPSFFTGRALFGGSQGSGIQRLIVTTADTPEPAVVPEASSLIAWSILASAISATCYFRRRHTRASEKRRALAHAKCVE
jgi:hypothetical protein